MNLPTLRRIGVVTAALVSFGLLTACGSQGSGSPGTASDMSLTLGVPGPTTSAAAFVYAEEAGLFEKHGVEVSIVDKGALAPSEVAAGKVELAQYGTGAAFAPTEAGRNMAIIYSLMGNSTGAVIVAEDSPALPGENLEETLMQLSGKRVGVQGQGGSSYGNASVISDYIAEQGGDPLQLVPLPDYGAMTAQMVSHQIDASIVFANPFLDAIDDNKIRVLVPSTDEELAELEGANFAAISVFGRSETLAGKSEAVTAFVKSIQEAYDMMDAAELSEIAETLHDHPLLAALSVENIERQLELDKPFWRPSDGEITESSWDASLAAMSSWGLTQDLTDDAFSFEHIVDMSYYDAATK